MTRCTVPCKNFDTCGNLRTPEAKTGFCRSCASKIEFAKTIKGLFSDPEYRAAHGARVSEQTKHRHATDPAFKAISVSNLTQARAKPGFKEKAVDGIRARHERLTKEAIEGFTPEQIITFEAFRNRDYSKMAARKAVLSGISPYAKQEAKAAQLDEMYRLRGEGMSYDKIGDALGVSGSAIHRTMSLSGRGMIGIPKPPRKATSKPCKQSTPDLSEAAILFGKHDQYNKPWTVERLAERYGVPPDAIEKAVARPST